MVLKNDIDFYIYGAVLYHSGDIGPQCDGDWGVGGGEVVYLLF